VGYIAAPPALFEPLLDQKILSVMATSEFDERLVYGILASGSYRKHVERVKNRLAQHKPAVVKGLTDAGLMPMHQDHAAVFVWAQLPAGVQGELLADDATGHGFFLLPGEPFSLAAADASWMRFNMAWSNDVRLFRYLRERLPVLQKAAAADFPAQGAQRPVR
jgi:DNA-binding transcriptional MocR family regulator